MYAFIGITTLLPVLRTGIKILRTIAQWFATVYGFTTLLKFIVGVYYS